MDDACSATSLSGPWPAPCALGLSSLYMLVKLIHQHGVSLAEIVFWRQAGLCR
jgi:hypothetical protein